VLRRLLTVALLGAALTAPLPAGASAAADPHYEEPVVGECHNYGYKRMLLQSDTTPAVDCTNRHTAKVVAVPQIPSGETWATMKANKFRKIYALIDRKCKPAYHDLLGVNARTREMSAYAGSFFLPTQAQRDAGARWLRCDVYAMRAKALTPLRYDAAPLVPTPMPERVRKCMKAKTLYYTTCDASHAWKATGAFILKKTSKYPTETQVRRQALAKCPSRTTTRTYRWVYPTTYQWKHGNKVVVCFSKTTG